MLGAPLSKYGSRSPHETSVRATPPPDNKTPATGSSRTPLQDTYGIITPSALHFERHHSGVPDIDPANARIADPWVGGAAAGLQAGGPEAVPVGSRIHFVECSGNGRSEYSGNLGADPATESWAGELQ